MPLFSQHTPQQNGAATLLRRYRPLETRATGGFGSVEICLDTRLQRRVAIKRIPLVAEGMPTPTGSTAAALAEARTASMLQHPNIVSVIDFTYDASFAYLVMEYVDGLSLEEFLAQVDGHSLTYDEEAHIADSLCQALAYAHENGVLHLDIKPANVLIDHSGHVKLADFGMACLTSAAGWGGARGGTIGYMSPEQLDGSVVDERSDLFSLACVLYESLCGGKPFVAATPADSLKRIEAGVEAPSELLPDIPASAEHALLQALSPAPESRPALADDFAEALLSEMGNARQGKKSLARMIARMTSDEIDPAELPEDDEPTATDPAKGLLGTGYPQARLLLGAIASGLSVACSSFAILHAMGLDQVPAILSSIAIGIAGGAAPQIGSALLAAGLFTMVINATPLVVARVGTHFAPCIDSAHRDLRLSRIAIVAGRRLPCRSLLGRLSRVARRGGNLVRARHDLRKVVTSCLCGGRNPWGRYAGPGALRFVLHRSRPHLRRRGSGTLISARPRMVKLRETRLSPALFARRNLPGSPCDRHPLSCAPYGNCQLTAREHRKCIWSRNRILYNRLD